jgi:hypothetical protein
MESKMRKVLISAAAAVSALAFAAPAAAQYYPAPPPAYGGYGYDNGYGYNNGYGGVRSLQVRIDRVLHQINRLDRQNLMSDRWADRLRRESFGLERQLRYAARNGLNPYEANDLSRRVAVLEQRVRHYSVSRYGNNGQWGYNGYGRDGWSDRDRDGRNDRYEDDRGRRHDGGWDRDDD